MGKKMYYNEEEAAAKLGCSVDDLSQYVSEEKIRVFKDGLRNMYNAGEVDALAAEMGLGGAEAGADEIVLTPADTSLGDDEIELTLSSAGEDTDASMDAGGSSLTPISLGTPESGAYADAVDLATEADDVSGAEDDKDGTAIAVEEGGSIFDTGDFEVEAADSMAQTQVSPTLEEQIAMEGVGSGSGLLDLTRESDDTSLGAEILEHIDADSEEAPELIGEELSAGLSGLASTSTITVAAEPMVVEEIDPMAGLFGGMVIGCVAIGMVAAALALSAMLTFSPPFVAWLGDNFFAVIIGSVAVLGIGALAGFMISKSAAERQAAIQRAGG